MLYDVLGRFWIGDASESLWSMSLCKCTDLLIFLFFHTRYRLEYSLKIDGLSNILQKEAQLLKKLAHSLQLFQPKSVFQGRQASLSLHNTVFLKYSGPFLTRHLRCEIDIFKKNGKLAFQETNILRKTSLD